VGKGVVTLNVLSKSEVFFRETGIYAYFKSACCANQICREKTAKPSFLVRGQVITLVRTLTISSDFDVGGNDRA